MPLPDISHLQYLLLIALLDAERSGRDLRALLAEQGHKKSGPAFYQLMSRMEDAKLVKGRYETKMVEGQQIKERVYKVLASGVTAAESVHEFYAGVATARKLGWGL